MTVIHRTDSRGNSYEVWAQRQQASCAVASIWMAKALAQQMCIQDTEWNLAWRMYQHTVQNIPYNQASSSAAPTGPMSIDPSQHQNDQTTFYNQFSVAGTFPVQVESALKGERLKTEARSAAQVPLPGPGGRISLIANKISPSTPAIVMLGWYSGTGQNFSRNGGHFVVAVNTNSNNLVFLDPWGGILVEAANDGLYRPPYAANTGHIEVAIYIRA